MIPRSKITISPEGNSKIEGLERTDQCFKLSEIANSAGKVVDDQDKDHAPVIQKTNIKN